MYHPAADAEQTEDVVEHVGHMEDVFDRSAVENDVKGAFQLKRHAVLVKVAEVLRPLEVRVVEGFTSAEPEALEECCRRHEPLAREFWFEREVAVRRLAQSEAE